MTYNFTTFRYGTGYRPQYKNILLRQDLARLTDFGTPQQRRQKSTQGYCLEG